MSHNELKRFFMSHAPTGLDIADLVKDNGLEGWRIDIERKYTTDSISSLGLQSYNKYRYEITFERTIS